MAKNIDIKLKLSNPKLYDDLVDLTTKVHPFKVSLDKGIEKEIKALKDKLSTKEIPVFVKPSATKKDINELREVIQDNLKPINVKLSVNKSEIVALQRTIQDALKVNLNLGSRGGGRISSGGGSANTSLALLREQARFKGSGLLTPLERGDISSNQLQKARKFARDNRLGTDSINIASRGALASLESVEKRESNKALRFRTKLIEASKKLEQDALNKEQRELEKNTRFRTSLVFNSNRKEQSQIEKDNKFRVGLQINSAKLQQQQEAKAIADQAKSTKFQTGLVFRSNRLEEAETKKAQTENLKNAKFQVKLVENSQKLEENRVKQEQAELAKNNKFKVGLQLSSVKLQQQQEAKDLVEQSKNTKFQVNLVKQSQKLEADQLAKEVTERARNTKFQTRLVENSQKLEEQQRRKDEQEQLKRTKFQTSLVQGSQRLEEQQKKKEESDFLKQARFQTSLVKGSQRLEMQAEAQAREKEKLTAQFNKGQLPRVALIGKARAIAEFEEERGLKSGSVDASKVGGAGKLSQLTGGRFSFDIARAFKDPEAFNELAFAGLFGGKAGAIGGLAGGAALGRPGVFLGSAITQGIVGQVEDVFGKIKETLLDAARAGLQFQSSVTGIASSFLSSSKVFGKNGEELPLDQQLAFQTTRARGLLRSGRTQLNQLGLGTSQQASALSAITTGLTESGFDATNEQTLQLALPILARIKATDPEVLQNEARLKNSLQDLLTGTLKGNAEIAPAFRSIQPQIKSALQTNDIDALIKAFSKFNVLIKSLTLSTTDANPALAQINSALDGFKVSLGDSLTKALIPGLNKLASFLNDEKFTKGLERAGEIIGNTLNSILESILFFANGLDKAPAIQSLVTTGASAAGSAATGLPIGQIQGFLNLVDLINSSAKAGAGPQKSPEGKVVPNENILRDITKESPNIDEGTPEGAFRKSFNDLRIKNLNGEISDDVFKAQTSRLKSNFNLDRQLANIDTGTREGQLEAGINSINKQVIGGNLTRDIADTQIARLQQNTGFERELAGTDQLTFRGQLQAGLTGINQAEFNQSISPDVAESQRQNIFFQVAGQAGDALVKLTETIVGTNRAFEDLKTKSSDLANQEIIAKNALDNFGKSAEIQALQGQDKLQALARQIVEKGGINPLRGTLGQTFLDTPEDTRKRELASLQKQFEIEESKFRSPDEDFRGIGPKRASPFQAQLGLERSALQKNLTGIKREREDLPLEEFKLKLNSARNIVDLGTKLGGDSGKLNEAIPGFGDAFKKSQEDLKGIGEKLGLSDTELSSKLTPSIDKISTALDSLINDLVGKISQGVSQGLNGATPSG